MKITLLTLVRPHDSIMHPLGSFHVAAAIKNAFKNDVDIRLLNGSVDTADIGLVKNILSTDPDYVGLSTTTIYSPRLLSLAKLILERKPNTIIFAGGFRIGQYGKTAIQTDLFKFLILGEAENAVVQAISGLEAKNSIDNIIGVMTKNNLDPDFAEVDISTQPSPWLLGFAPDKKFTTSYWELERGCAFKCSYCYLTGYKRKPSQVSLDRVEAELRIISNQYPWIEQLYISNPTFTTDTQRANNLLDLFYKITPHMKWDVSLRPEHVTEELITKLSKFKKINLQMGIQSLNPSILKHMHRAPIDKIEYAKMFHKLQIFKIPFTVDLIIGYPGESLESYKEGVKYLVSVGVRNIISYRLQIYPNTEIGRNVNKLGLKYYPSDIPEDTQCFKPYVWSQERGEVQPFRIYETPMLTRQDLAHASVWTQEYIKQHLK